MPNNMRLNTQDIEGIHDLACKQRNKQLNRQCTCLEKTMPRGELGRVLPGCKSEGVHACSMPDKAINQETISRQTCHEEHHARR